MNPVRSNTMLNFIHWVAIHKRHVKNLKDLSEHELMDIVDEYEGGKLRDNWELKAKWESGFYMLLKSEGDWQGYGDVRRELKRARLG